MNQKPDFISVLSQYRDLVWSEVESYLGRVIKFPSYCQISDRYQSLIDFHYKLTSEYPIRKGKYLRPTLLLLAAQSMGVDTQKALKTAAAMQVSEDWLLCHDDIQDHSLERRGLPTIQNIYGVELGINSGDTLHILMWKILMDNFNLIGPEKTQQIQNEFFNILNRTAFGQTVEIKWSLENETGLSDEDVFLILDGKTSYYTIAGPLRLGAILADASPDQLDVLYRFGCLVGRAFQITDDLLDLTSNFSGLKKQQGNDIYEGKRSLMLVHLLRSVQPKDKKEILNILAKTRQQKTPDDVEFVIQKMNQSGSFDYARKIVADLVIKAKKMLDQDLDFIKIQPFRQHLLTGIDFIVNRDH